MLLRTSSVQDTDRELQDLWSNELQWDLVYHEYVLNGIFTDVHTGQFAIACLLFGDQRKMQQYMICRALRPG